MLNTPILFLVFNRPDTTRLVFERIRQAQPRHLYIAADGPRARDGEKALCEEVRNIVSNVDWVCEVKHLFRENNLGCGKGVSQAITWFFENVEEGIILEDDCVPDLSFFNFCEVNLDRYREDRLVSAISGNNFFPSNRQNSSYYFSAYGHIWGWATWRKAWKNYMFDLKHIPETIFLTALNQYQFSQNEIEYWLGQFRQINTVGIDTWDYQWLFCQWLNNTKSIIPAVNLVTNIGFGKDATHTIVSHRLLENIPAMKISHITHPTQININRKADLNMFNRLHSTPRGLLPSLRAKILGIFDRNPLKTIQKSQGSQF